MRDEVGAGSCHDAMMAGPFLEGDEVRRDDGRDELVLISDQRNLRDEKVGLQLVFNGLRRNELAAGRFQQFLLAVGDVKESVLIEVGDIAGAEPAIGVKALRVCFRLEPITCEDCLLYTSPSPRD